MIQAAQWPHIAVLLKGEDTFAHQILRGIRHYMELQDLHWVLKQADSLLHLDVKVAYAYHSKMKIKGIFARVSNYQRLEQLGRLKIPIVDLVQRSHPSPFPCVVPDTDSIAELAAEHLLSKGFQRFVFLCGNRDAYSLALQDSFIRVLGKRKFFPEVYLLPPAGNNGTKTALRNWISHLPSRVGILAADDYLAKWVVSAALRHDFEIPADVGIVGVGNNEKLALLSRIPFSSIQFAGEKMGFEAAKALHQMLQGMSVSSPVLRLPAEKVIARESTNAKTFDDPVIAKAIGFIQKHALESISVDEVVRHAGVSRRTLERKFQLLLKHSPYHEIVQFRIEKAKELLIKTDQPVGRIAEICYFDPTKFGAIFRRKCGLPPSGYRKQFQMS